MKTKLFIILICSLISCSNYQETDSVKKTRNDKWIDDIAFFENEYLKNSKTFNKDATKSCKIQLNKLKTNISTLSDNQIILELSKCVAKANNGHTTIHLGNMGKIPLRFFWFGDDLHIIKTDSISSKYLGSKVLKINSIKINDVLKKLNPYLSGINSWKKYTSTNYLSSPEILNGLGLSNKNYLTLHLLKNGDTVEVKFNKKKIKSNKYEYETWSNLSPNKNEKEWKHLKSNSTNLPLYIKNMQEGVSYKFFDAKKVAYFSINALWYKCSDFKGKINQFLDSLKTKTNYNVILDLRYYTGGNFLEPTRLATKPPKIIDEDKKIYLLTSNMTFSAGLITAARIKHFGKEKVIIVGENVGDDLEFWAEGVYTKLPNSGITIQDSKYFHDWKNDTFTIGKTFWVNLFYGVPAKNLNVNKEIILTFNDYINNDDPILNWIFSENKMPKIKNFN